MESTDLCFGCFAAPRPRGGRCPQCGYDPSLPRPLTALPVGLVLNRQYIIGRVLGHPGGFGITYLAFDQRLHKRIAIKEYLPRDLATRAADSTRVQPYSTQDGDLYRYGLQQFEEEEEARTLSPATRCSYPGGNYVSTTASPSGGGSVRHCANAGCSRHCTMPSRWKARTARCWMPNSASIDSTALRC